MLDTAQASRALDVVMLVDDDVFMLEIMAEMLAQVGAKHVLKLESARDAMKSFVHQRPTLLICDLRMPDMDGIEFLRDIAQLGYTGGVVLHSGADAGVMRAAERLAKAHGLHVLGAVEKPLDKEKLTEFIQSIPT